MIKLNLLLLLLSSFISFALSCHPKINHHLPQYIIGYGSLIEEQSKKRTDPTAKENRPVLIKGYQRTWGVHSNFPGLNTTFLSVSKNKSSFFNGVIYQLSNPENIQQFDQREMIYCRKKLRIDEINLLSGTLPAQKQVWIYVPMKKYQQIPTYDYPIVQSYVDVFMRGCLQIEKQFKINNFAKNCIKTTAQWPNYWVNDRIFPRSPSLYEPYALKIDTLLKEILPQQFKHIKPE